MSGLREQLRLGIFGEGARSAVITLVLGATAIVVSLFYDALNHGPYVLFLRTPLDDLIPVVDRFVVPYVSLRPFIYVSAVLFLLFRSRIYRSAAVSMIVVLVISYAFYAFLQTYIERPAIAGDDLFSRMIRDVYAGDQPFNREGEPRRRDRPVLFDLRRIVARAEAAIQRGKEAAADPAPAGEKGVPYPRISSGKFGKRLRCNQHDGLIVVESSSWAGCRASSS